MTFDYHSAAGRASGVAVIFVDDDELMRSALHRLFESSKLLAGAARPGTEK